MKRSASLARKTPLRRASPGAVSRAQLDRLARRLVVELRDGGTCQRCGATSATHQIHWSHVVTRAAASCRWRPWNAKALCAGCHRWWASHPAESGVWWRAKWPERAVALDAWRAQRRRPKVDLVLERAWLEQEVTRMERARATHGRDETVGRQGAAPGSAFRARLMRTAGWARRA